MWKNIGLEKCVSFIEYGSRGKIAGEAVCPPAITISRLTGAGGYAVASALVDYFQSTVPSRQRWTVFDQNLVEKVLEEHRLSKQVAKYMEEGHVSMVRDSIEEWMGLHPSSWTMVQKTNATILRLAQMGHVILIGRGAMVITSKLKNVFHVRLVGSLENRIEYGQRFYGLDRKKALDFIKKRDEARKRYLKDNFDVDPDNPLLYHIIINTDLVSYDQAASLIGDEVIKRFNLLKVEKSMPVGARPLQNRS